MGQFSEMMRQQTDAGLQAVSNLTSERLQTHVSNLEKLSADSLTTTKSVIQLQRETIEQMHAGLEKLSADTLNKTKSLIRGHSQALEQMGASLQKLSANALSKTESLIRDQSKAIDQLHVQTSRRLRWLMSWPLLASICLSLAMLVGASSWAKWEMDQANETVRLANAKAALSAAEMLKAQTDFCNTPVGKKICTLQR